MAKLAAGIPLPSASSLLSPSSVVLAGCWAGLAGQTSFPVPNSKAVCLGDACWGLPVAQRAAGSGTALVTGKGPGDTWHHYYVPDDPGKTGLQD